MSKNFDEIEGKVKDSDEQRAKTTESAAEEISSDRAMSSRLKYQVSASLCDRAVYVCAWQYVWVGVCMRVCECVCHVYVCPTECLCDACFCLSLCGCLCRCPCAVCVWVSAPVTAVFVYTVWVRMRASVSATVCVCMPMWVTTTAWLCDISPCLSPCVGAYVECGM